MRRRIGRSRSGLAISAGLLLAAALGHADTVTVSGSAGTVGAIGGPGATGGTGGAGGSASAAAQANDPFDSATATGGRGGNGGRGGAGSAGSPDGGSGGLGGAGGDATALATNVAPSGQAIARATGGAGGNAGNGGPPAAGGATGQQGDGGTAGSASATAHAQPQSGDASASITANGGNGGTGFNGGRGGDAIGDALAEAVGSGNANIFGAGQFSFSVTGGFGTTISGGVGGDGGDASSQSRAIAHGTGNAFAFDSARGGSGGGSVSQQIGVGSGSGGNGGFGSSSAFAQGMNATASASAAGGFGGLGRGAGNLSGHGTGALARAEAHAVIDATAIARAQGGGGADAEDGANAGMGAGVSLVDAVSGSAGGILRLEQHAIGGHGGVNYIPFPGGAAGSGGSVLSTGTFANAGGGDLDVTLTASGGYGGQGARGGNGGDAEAGGSATAAADRNATIRVTARAGSGGDGSEGAPLGGEVRASRVEATTSGAGRAVAELDAVQGSHGRGVSGVDGRSLSLANQVDANSGAPGSVRLLQKVTAGAGGWADTSGDGGDGGEASSTLDYAKSVASLEAIAEANGGYGALGFGAGGNGGDANANVRLRGDAGDVRGEATARAGAGQVGFGGPNGVGGSALATTDVASTGDGNDLVGLATSSGYQAAADVIGDAGGDSAVDVLADAVASPDPGSSAIATAFARNQGAAAVRAEARANGGRGGAGTAQASARGESVDGDVDVVVSQTGGSTDYYATPGDGANSILSNGVSGQTNGALRLEQRAIGGDAWGGTSGDGDSSLDVAHSGAGPLTLIVEGRGGNANTNTDLVAVGGSGRVFARGEATGDVTLEGLAAGGAAGADPSISPPSVAGAAGIDLFARSTAGGAVSVRGEAVGGSSSETTGASTTLDNAVGGDTTGALSLTQIARGGSSFFGNGGHASNRLTHTAAAASFDAYLEANGGKAERGAIGGDATGELDVVNSAGSLSAVALVQGGNSEIGAIAGIGGSAQLTIRAQTSGDGHSISVGVPAGFLFGAAGGSAEDAPAVAQGGDAVSSSIGEALGDSAVSVYDRASGGSGSFYSFGNGANGGNASSHAEGMNQGAQAVDVSAFAAGGYSAGVGGVANASAYGASLFGDVRVRAEQLGGRSASGDGASSTMLDTVDGETAGFLTLEQRATAGDSLYGNGKGGDADSQLTVVNSLGGAGSMVAAGTGGFGDLGGSAVAGASLSSATDQELTALAIATGGQGSVRGGDARVTFAEAMARNAANVSSIAHALAGDGSGPGDGGDAFVDHAARGASAGTLHLEQRAEAGNGGSNFSGSLRGQGGDATSLLDGSFSALQLDAISQAIGGGGIGEGGDAVATGFARNPMGSATSFTSATGGSGGAYADRLSSRGGDAWAEGGAEAHGVGQSGNAAISAVGGTSYGVLLGGDLAQPDIARGGDAHARVDTRSEDGDVYASAQAFGGGGGTVEDGGAQVGGRGGNADAVAYGEGNGAGFVSVQAEARSGTGGAGSSGSGAAGDIDIQARGVSTGGGDVETIVVGIAAGQAGDGSELTLTDRTTGATAGSLLLTQFANGGNGIGGLGGRGASILNGINEGGGSIQVEAFGSGGTGVIGGEGFASASAIGSGDESVWVLAQALGGQGVDAFSNGGVAGDGGVATLGTVYGSSAGGGDVRVIGRAIAGSGGYPFFSMVGNSPDVVLHNAVDGDTSGALWLEQSAQSLDYYGGVSGHAESTLIAWRSTSSLSLQTDALGADAFALADATNATGDAEALALATSANGTDASSEARATSLQDGARVSVGRAASVFAPPETGAIGATSYGAAAPGDATSLSVGTHLGDGTVTVWDNAVGGNRGDAGVGGDASSTARASNQGASFVEAHSRAVGGRAAIADYPYTGGVGGDAVASSQAEGLGEVLAQAVAFGGHGTEAHGGDADAFASANGASGSAIAIAGTSRTFANGYWSLHGRAIASADAKDGATAHSRASQLELTAQALPVTDAETSLLLAPDASWTSQALQANPNAAAFFGSHASEMLAIADIDAANPNGSAEQVTGSIELNSLDFRNAGFTHFAVAFLDPLLQGTGFENLDVTLEQDGIVVWQLHVTPDDVSPLDDRVVVSLGVGLDTRLGFSISMAEPGTAASFRVALAAVPEPSVAVLLATAIGLLVRRRARNAGH